MVAASKQMQIALKEIGDYRMELNIPINPSLDPFQTGLIGDEITPLTTTLGNLEAKQTALNPDFAALILRWLWELDIQIGETLGLQLSGSFPSLNIAAIIACDVMQLNPIISSSIGSSSFGANLPEFTYLDMEKRLYEEGVIQHCSSIVTPGGNNDDKILLWENSDSLIDKVIERTGYPLLHPSTLDKAIQKKWQLFHSAGIVKGFINVGGNHSSIGNCSHSATFPMGLVRKMQACQDPNRGLLMYFFEQRKPVIHLLNIRSLAIQANLPLTPNLSDSAGNSDIYFKVSQPLWINMTLVILMLFSWLLLRSPYRIPRSCSTTSTKVR